MKIVSLLIFPLIISLTRLSFGAESAGLPAKARKNIENQILGDLKIREKRLGCRIDDIKIVFSHRGIDSREESAAEYQVNYSERCARNISTRLSVKKKVVYNKTGNIVSISPVEQELNFENDKEIAF